MTRASIAGLNVYPVKGCRGVAVERAALTVRGLAIDGAGDREWMVVDATGRFVSQREQPRMALIRVGVEADALAFEAPGMRALGVRPPATSEAQRRAVVVWNSTVTAIDAGDPAANWLSDFLRADVRLVRFAPEHVRGCNPEFVGTSGANTMFADAYPLLVVGAASLDDLNVRLAARGERALPMNRFRPNVVVTGLEPYDEDHVDTISTSDVVLKLVKPCVRCRVTTTDQDDAKVAHEPLATLAGYRMDDRRGGVTFGMNAIVVAGEGRSLAVGSAAAIEYRFSA